MSVGDKFFVLLLLIVRGRCWSGGSNSSQCDYSTFGKLLYALYKDVEFMHSKKNQLNIDSAFGLALAEANLETILTSENWKYLNDENLNLILEIRELTEESRKFVKENLKTETDRLFGKVLTNVELWIRPIPWKNSSSVALSPRHSNLNASSVDDLMHAGAPQETESDSCLLLLINNYINRKFCQLSNDCVEMIMKADGSRGYSMTHRLLIIQVANALGCERHPSMDNNRQAEDFCRIILQDLLDLEAAGFPGVALDLAIEQIFVCGMEGHTEFVTSHYKNILLTLPNSRGCYSARGFRRMKYHRAKRSSNPMDFGCDNHTSGVAAAALSLLLRECIEISRFYTDEAWGGIYLFRCGGDGSKFRFFGNSKTNEFFRALEKLVDERIDQLKAKL